MDDDKTNGNNNDAGNGNNNDAGNGNNKDAGSGKADAGNGDGNKQSTDSILGGDANGGDKGNNGKDGKDANDAQGDTKKDAYVPISENDITKPDGMDWDAKAWKDFEPLITEAKLNKEQVQKIIDLYASKVSGIASLAQAAELNQSQEWRKASVADTRFGGAKFDESVTLANKTIQAFGSPELMSFLKSSPFGNHPELINFFVNVGKALSEDGWVDGKPSKNVRIEDIMYKK